MHKVSLSISLPQVQTQIVIGSDVFWELRNLIAKKYTHIYVLTETNVGPLYLGKVLFYLKQFYPESQTHSYTFEAGEESKNLSIAEDILLDMQESLLDRSSLLLTLGGWVVSDLGGFVASIYMRGIDCAHISTTIEGMVDASIWGKTGVNFNHQKNYIGSFHHPVFVLMDVCTLKTLTERVFIQGFGEIVKHGAICDKGYFLSCSQKNPLTLSDEELIAIILRSVQIKVQVVEKDAKESSLRRMLNFGHTIGHAIESLKIGESDFLFHGEAVAIGMVAETKIGELMGWYGKEVTESIESTLSKLNLPIRVSNVDTDEIFDLLLKDKKQSHGMVIWALIKEIWVYAWDSFVPPEIAKAAIQYIISK